MPDFFTVRFLLTPPGGSRPTLVVDTRAQIDEAAIAQLRSDLHGLGCPNGILFDRDKCVMLRDTYADMSASSIIVDAEIPVVCQSSSVPLGPSRKSRRRGSVTSVAFTSVPRPMRDRRTMPVCHPSRARAGTRRDATASLRVQSVRRHSTTMMLG